MRANVRGFTLIELIIGIVVFTIIMLVIIGVIGPQSRLSIEPIWQIRASELAQSLLTEINAKSFDEQSDHSGGNTRCNEGQSCSVVLSSRDGNFTNFSYLAFDSLGRPLNGAANCNTGTPCRVTLTGESSVDVCIESQGYVHAC